MSAGRGWGLGGWWMGSQPGPGKDWGGREGARLLLLLGTPRPPTGLPCSWCRPPALRPELAAHPLWARSPCRHKAPLLVRLCLPSSNARWEGGWGRTEYARFYLLQFGASAAEPGDSLGSEADTLTPNFAGLHPRARSAPSPKNLARYGEPRFFYRCETGLER